MASQRQGRGTITILAVMAAGVVIVLLGVLKWDPGGFAPLILSRQVEPQAPAPRSPEVAVAPSPDRTSTVPSGPAAAPPDASPPPAPVTSNTAEGVLLPTFDLVRVEPSGESVIAGRGAPGATIELLRDGQIHARVAADASGLFAFVPPPLPTGSHQLMLQSIAPGGDRQRSRESVTIVINENRTGRPLVALTSPDKPTVLLSNPEPPAQVATQADVITPPVTAPQEASPPPSAAPAPTPPRPEVRIASVETEDGGRLFVSGQAAPGATVRLYLNEIFIAPGGVGADGKVSFAIGGGVKPGDYRVRLDDVDPVSGNVRSRAEVAFNVPAEVAVQLPQPQPAQPAFVPPPAPMATAPESAPAVGDQNGTHPAVPVQQAPATPRSSQTASAEPDELANKIVVVPNINTTIVSRGDNLWRISQRIYGHGTRFTVIYGANQKQIRNPNLIYPGQVFVLPPDGESKT